LGEDAEPSVGGGSVLRMRRMLQSVQKRLSLRLRASDEAEKGAEDRPRAPAELHIASPLRAYVNYLSTRSSGFGRPSLRSGGRAFTGRKDAQETHKGACTKGMREYLCDDTVPLREPLEQNYNYDTVDSSFCEQCRQLGQSGTRQASFGLPRSVTPCHILF